MLVENFSVLNLEKCIKELKQIDLFISCGSFEERCINCSEILFKSNISIETAIIFNYKETDKDNLKEVYTEKIIDNLKAISNNVYIFNEASVDNPEEGLKNFISFVSKSNINLILKKIMIEITVFTKPYFFLLFKVLKEIYELKNYLVVYTEPETYSKKHLTKNEIILTEGLDRIECIPGYYGSSVNPHDVLIVILGFEGKRSLEVFYNIDPEITYAINGFPSFQPGWEKISLEANMDFLRKSLAYNNIYFAPAINPFETMKTISKIKSRIEKSNKNHNIIIAPLGTKMQAFGAMLYSFKNSKIKIIYPFPTFFKTDYSYKFSKSWIFNVNLTNL